MNDLYTTSMQTFLDFIKDIACALFIALIIRSFIVQPYYIPSGSMLNTLHIGDRLFVTKFSYGIHIPFINKEIIDMGQPEKGDIIVFPFPKDPSIDFVKRVVATPGDVVEIRNKQFYRNGKAVEETYIIHSDPLIINSHRDNFGPVTVPEGQVFVMGDNRDNSRDSREWGMVEKKTIRGKAWVIFWSSKSLFDIHWDRVGNLLN